MVNRKQLSIIMACAMLATSSLPVYANEATPIATATNQTVKAPTVSQEFLINYYTKNLDVTQYMKLNPDLVTVFGDNIPMYVLHYVNCGIKEGRRTGKWDPVAYVLNNADTIYAEALAGTSGSFNLASYKSRYPDLVAAFGNNDLLYIQHYLQFGIFEKRFNGAHYDPVLFAYLYPNAEIKTTADMEAFKKAQEVERVKASGSAPSSGTSTVSSGGSSSSSGGGSSSSSGGGSSSGGSSEDKPSEEKPDAESDVVNQLFLRTVKTAENSSESFTINIGLNDTWFIDNPEDLDFEELWASYDSEWDAYIQTRNEADAVIAQYPIVFEDFTYDDEYRMATLELNSDFFGEAIKAGNTLPEELLVDYRTDSSAPEDPENPEDPDTPENPENPDTPEDPENPEDGNDPEEGNDELVFDDMSSNIRSAQFKLKNGDVVKLPETISDLQERGYYFTTGDLTTEVAAGETAEIGMYSDSENINNSHKVLMTVKNFSEEEVTVADCIAYKAYWANSSTDSIMVMPGGITLDSLLGDVESIAGAPDYSAFGFDPNYYYYLTEEDSKDDAVNIKFEGNLTEADKDESIISITISTLTDAQELYDELLEGDDSGETPEEPDTPVEPEEPGDTDEALKLELDEDELLPDVCERPENLIYDDLVTPRVGSFLFRGERISDTNEDGEEEFLRYDFVSLQDLLDANVTLVPNQKLKFRDGSEMDITVDALIGPMSGTMGTHVMLDGVDIEVGLWNNSPTESVPLSECLVWKVSLGYGDKEAGLTFELLGDNDTVEPITFDSTMMDMRAALGAPSYKYNGTSSYSRTWQFKHLWHGEAETVNDTAAVNPYVEINASFDSEYTLDRIDIVIPIPVEIIMEVEEKNSLDDYSVAEYSNITIGGLVLTVPTSVSKLDESGFVPCEYEDCELLTDATEVPAGESVKGYFVKRSEGDSEEPTVLVYAESYENTTDEVTTLGELGIYKVTVSNSSVANTVYYCDSYLGMSNVAIGGTVEEPTTIDILESMYGTPTYKVEETGYTMYTYEIADTDLTAGFGVDDADTVIFIGISTEEEYEAPEVITDNFLLNQEQASTITVGGQQVKLPILVSELSELQVNPVDGYTPLEGSMVEPGMSAMCLYNVNDIYTVRIETAINNSGEAVDASTLNARKVVIKYNTITEGFPEDKVEQANLLSYNNIMVCDSLEEVLEIMGTTTDVRNGVAYCYTYTDELSGVMTNVELGFKESQSQLLLTDISVEVVTADVPTTGAL